MFDLEIEVWVTDLSFLKLTKWNLAWHTILKLLFYATYLCEVVFFSTDNDKIKIQAKTKSAASYSIQYSAGLIFM